MRGKAMSGAFRRERVSLWVSVPSKGGDHSGAGATAFLNTLSAEIRKDGIRNILSAVARARAASAGDRITRRMLKEEREAFREAERVFKQVERECPLQIERLSPADTFTTLYLSHHQNANSAPPLSAEIALGADDVGVEVVGAEILGHTDGAGDEARMPASRDGFGVRRISREPLRCATEAALCDLRPSGDETPLLRRRVNADAGDAGDTERVYLRRDGRHIA